MHIKTLKYLLFAGLIASVAVDVAQAQYSEALLKGIKNRNSSSRYSVRTVQNQLVARSGLTTGLNGLNRRTYSNPFSSSSAQQSKPFTGLQRGPAVTPYLRLNGSLDSVADYYSNVRPGREQQQSTLREQRQLNLRRQQLNQAAAQGPYSLSGDPEAVPTGHPTSFLYMGNFQQTGGFYPGVQGLQKQRIDQ